MQGYCIRVGNIYFISILGVVPRLAIVILDSFFPEAVLRGLYIYGSLRFGFVGILTSVFTFPGSPQKANITYGVKAYLQSIFSRRGGQTLPRSLRSRARSLEQRCGGFT